MEELFRWLWALGMNTLQPVVSGLQVDPPFGAGWQLFSLCYSSEGGAAEGQVAGAVPTAACALHEPSPAHSGRSAGRHRRSGLVGDS